MELKRRKRAERAKRTPLEKLALEASEHGMSYGKYIAWKESHKE